MVGVEELQESTRDMDAPSLLRFLITERFPGRTLMTCSLRARSIVLLKMIAEIDAATPILFCHAPEPYPESLEYRAKLVGALGLSDIREPAEDEGSPLPDDRDHSEGLWAEDPDNKTRVYKTVHLNRTLADFDCWISGVYHGPYGGKPKPRIIQEGRLVRINPLADWSQDEVRQFMAENGLRYHPRSAVRPKAPDTDDPKLTPTYSF